MPRIFLVIFFCVFRMVVKFNRIYEFLPTGFILWCLSAICVELLLVQVELVEFTFRFVTTLIFVLNFLLKVFFSLDATNLLNIYDVFTRLCEHSRLQEYQVYKRNFQKCEYQFFKLCIHWKSYSRTRTMWLIIFLYLLSLWIGDSR